MILEAPKEVNGEYYIKIVANLNDRILVAEKGIEWLVAFTRRDFIEILYETLSWWPAVARSCGVARGLVEAMSKVDFERNPASKLGFATKPVVCTFFSKDCRAIYLVDKIIVVMPFRLFVKAAAREFTEQSHLDLRYYTPGSKSKLRKKWQTVLDILVEQSAIGSEVNS